MDDDASPAAACTTAAGGERRTGGIVGVLLLAGLFLPARDLVTHSLATEWRPSAELAGLLFLVALFALASAAESRCPW